MSGYVPGIGPGIVNEGEQDDTAPLVAGDLRIDPGGAWDCRGNHRYPPPGHSHPDHPSIDDGGNNVDASVFLPLSGS